MRILAGAQERESCRELFKTFQILLLASEYLLQWCTMLRPHAACQCSLCSTRSKWYM